jgi:hypothetical protein
MDEVVTNASVTVRASSPKRAMASTWRDSTELLDVHMNEFTGPLTNVSQRPARDAIEIAQPRTTMAPQHCVDGGSGTLYQGLESVWAALQAAPQPENPLDLSWT